VKRPLLCLAGLLAALPAWAEVETYRIDPEHSAANWQVRHLVARVSGSFSAVSGTIVLDRDNLARSRVEATIDVASLDSGHRKRDVHLWSDEFLDARRHPEMRFESTSVQPSGPDKGVINGNLTLRGVTRPVRLAYQILGFGNDPWDGYRAGLLAVANINRLDFGVSKFPEPGPIGNEVEVTLLVQGIKLGADGKPFSVKKAAEEKAAAEKAKAATPPAPTKEESLEEQLKRQLLRGIFK